MLILRGPLATTNSDPDSINQPISSLLRYIDWAVYNLAGTRMGFVQALWKVCETQMAFSYWLPRGNPSVCSCVLCCLAELAILESYAPKQAFSAATTAGKSCARDHRNWQQEHCQREILRACFLTSGWEILGSYSFRRYPCNWDCHQRPLGSVEDFKNSQCAMDTVRSSCIPHSRPNCIRRQFRRCHVGLVLPSRSIASSIQSMDRRSCPSGFTFSWGSTPSSQGWVCVWSSDSICCITRKLLHRSQPARRLGESMSDNSNPMRGGTLRSGCVMPLA